MTYYSQYGQDQKIDEILGGIKNGIFLDIGAHNGISFSNTYFFEKEKDWAGYCFEPHPRVYRDLEKNRKCQCLNKGVGTSNSILEFWEITGYAEMLSGFSSKYSDSHKRRIEREISNYGGYKEIKNIEVIDIMDFLNSNSIDRIDYLSIDTEGGEEEIIMSIDFDKIEIKSLSIENNYDDTKIIGYMKSMGYNHIKHHIDDIYYK
jgi:FkbM family methyltransferase